MAGTRNIDDVLHFRNDISPFLVHLTKSLRDGNGAITTTAKDVLDGILTAREVQSSGKQIAASWFGTNQFNTTPAETARFYSAACFTETPLAEVHTMLDIANRQIDLEPYGIVFLKDNLRELGVSPVWYLNNYPNNMQQAATALGTLATSHPAEAEVILPLISCFGHPIVFPGQRGNPPLAANDIDFYWEREWRMPHVRCPVRFTWDDVFVGLCPEAQIPYFEGKFAPIGFIDPQRTMKWYATKLIDARQRLNLKHSVV